MNTMRCLYRSRAAAAAAVLLAAALAGCASGGGEEKPVAQSQAPSQPVPAAATTAPPAPPLTGPLAIKWSVPAGAQGIRDQTYGRWVVGDSVYVGDTRSGLVRYDLLSGAPHPVPLGTGGRGKLCGMSPTAAGGTGVVAWSEDDKTCQTAGAVDLTTGTVRWTAPFTGIGMTSGKPLPAYIGDPMQLAVTADLVVISVGDDVTTFRLGDGAPGWMWTAPRTDTSARYVSGIVGDKATVLLGVSDSHLNEAYAVAVDAATGATRWTTELKQGDGPARSRYAYPVSLSPVVFVSQHSTTSTRYSDLVVFDAGGRVTSTIQETGPWGVLDMTSHPWGGLSGTVEWPVAVSDGVLYATAARGSYGSDRQVVAIDLATGTPRWTVPTGLPATVSSYAVLGADADGVYVSGQGLFDGGDLVVQKFAAKDGKPSPAGTLASAPPRLIDMTSVGTMTPRGYLVFGVSGLADQRVLLIAP